MDTFHSLSKGEQLADHQENKGIRKVNSESEVLLIIQFCDCDAKGSR